MKEKIKSFLTNKKNIFLFYCLLLYVVIVSLTGIGCPIKWFTGISCPGCGMTRSIYYLLKFDFAQSFRCHALTVIAIPSFIYIAFGKRPLFNSKKRENVFLLTLISLFLIYYLLRLFYIKNDIVTIDLNSSFMVKLYKNIRRLFL